MPAADRVAIRRRSARQEAERVEGAAAGLAVRPPAPGSAMATTRHWMLPSDVREIEPVVRDIVALCRAAGFSDRQCGLNVPVATTEALANAVLRGNCGEPGARVGVAVEVSATCLVVEVADEGPGFDLSAVEQSTAEADWFEREDGRGIFLMRALMDRVENACADGGAGHRLRLVLYRT